VQNPLLTLSTAQLERAVAIKQQIEGLEAEFTTLLSGEVSSAAPPVKRGPGRPPGVKAAVAKPRRKMGRAARARLSALAKARWKKAKAAGRTRL